MGKRLGEDKADKSFLVHEESETFDKTKCTTSGKYVKYSDGKLGSVSGWKSTDWIEIPDYATKYEYLTTTNNAISGLAFYSAMDESSWISSVKNSEAVSTAQGNIPATAKYVRFCYQNEDENSSSSLRLYIDGQEGYASMINEVVEKAADMVTESAVSRNDDIIYDNDNCMYGGYINKNSGAYVENSNYVNGFASSDYLPVVSGETLILNSNWTTQNVGLAFYKSDKAYISGVLIDNDENTEIVVPNFAEYIRFTARPKSNGSTSIRRSRTGADGLQWELDKIEKKLNKIDELGIVDKNGRHVLFVTNSFGLDVCTPLPQILANMGISEWNSVQRTYYGGRTYKDWVDNADSPTYVSFIDVFGNGLHADVNNALSNLLTMPWDVIVFSTVYTGTPTEGHTEPYLSQLIDMAKRICPNKAVKFYYMQTWQNWKANYSDIISVEKPIIKDHEIGIIPCGTAIENIRQIYSDDSYYHLAQEQSQYLHLAAGVAEYTGALTVAQVLFGDIAARAGKTLYDDDSNISATSESGNYGAVSVDSTNRAKCQRAAMFAIIHPWGTTDVSVING